jgi:hypothetical protein
VFLFVICFWLCAASLRDRPGLLLPVRNLLGDVEGAIAGPIVEQVGIAIVARADDVQIFLTLAGCQSARTSPIAISLFIDQQPLNQHPGEFIIRVEIITGRLGLLTEAAT